MDIFIKNICKETIKIEPRYLNNNFDNEIYKRLVRKVEGKCTHHGYIRKKSIEIYKILPGIIEMSTLSGYVNYEVYFYADICNPLNNTIVKAKVKNMNPFGILSESGYEDGIDFITVLEVVTPKNSLKINSEIDMDKLQIGDNINIEILSTKYQLGDESINVIGRIVEDETVKKIYYDRKEFHKDIKNDDEFTEDLIEEDEEDEDEEEDEEEEEEEYEDEAEEDEDEDIVEGDIEEADIGSEVGDASDDD